MLHRRKQAQDANSTGARDSQRRQARAGQAGKEGSKLDSKFSSSGRQLVARPAKGGVVALPDYDPTRVNELMPHPIYAWMRWVQILSPTAERCEDLRPMLDESFALVKARWKRRELG